MKLKRTFSLILVFYLIKMVCWSQTISLIPTVRNPNTFNPTLISSAGAGPINITNQTQSIQYNYPANLGNGKIEVSINVGTIPIGIGVFIEAGLGNGNVWEGISSGIKPVSSTPTTIITGIFTQKKITRILTLTINVTNMAQLYSGTYPLTLIYTLSAQ